jgi:RNA polymerase sigma-70 factor (ECF subfamily)
LKRRDPRVMAELYDRYGRAVYSVIFRIVRKRGEAEEIVQESFLRVWTRAHLFDETRGSLGSWLLTIGRNLAIDHMRASTARGDRLTTSEFHQLQALASYPLTLPADTERLRRAFASLKPIERTVIEFSYFEGMSQTEIAKKLDKPLGTIKTRVRTALETLRKSFFEPQSGPSEQGQQSCNRDGAPLFAIGASRNFDVSKTLKDECVGGQ